MRIHMCLKSFQRLQLTYELMNIDAYAGHNQLHNCRQRNIIRGVLKNIRSKLHDAFT
jgi:hypothetical protein